MLEREFCSCTFALLGLAESQQCMCDVAIGDFTIAPMRLIPPGTAEESARKPGTTYVFRIG